ncbi:MAG: YgaP-like transmembrane domain [Anaerolineae bacterium]
MDFVGFMSSTTGRALRVVVGIILVALALFGPNWSTALEVILLLLGILFIVVGALNLCLLAPLFGKPIKGGK